MRVVKYPHPMLTFQSKPLKKIDGVIRDIVAEMFDLMYEHNGVGLAANQVDLPYRLIVVNPTGDREQKDSEHVLINPTILKLRGNVEDEEGCLSYPKLRLIVPRAREVKFQAVDLKGQLQTYYWKGLEARIIQHETDHLDGVPFFERATASLSGNLNVALAKMRQEYADNLAKGLEPSQDEFEENVNKWLQSGRV